MKIDATTRRRLGFANTGDIWKPAPQSGPKWNDTWSKTRASTTRVWRAKPRGPIAGADIK